MKKRIFFKNAVILTLTSLILRVVGICLRIYIANSIGAEGMGLHALIFTVYTFASAVASSGLSLAVTRLVTDDFAAGGKTAVRAILRKAFLLSLLLGCGAMAVLYLFSDAIAAYALCDTRTALSLRILAFGLPFISISACFKGYFMARRNAKTPSNSQLLEQVVRILSVVLLLRPMSGYGLGYACAAVVIGNAVSEVLACLYLWLGYKKDTAKMTYNGVVKSNILSRLCSVFIPVAFTGHMNTALHMAENLIVPQALTRYTRDSSLGLAQFGMLKGMALPTLFFPASFLTSLSSLLVPEMSEYGAKNQRKSIARTAEFTLRITIVSSILIAGIFMTYPKEIAQLLYHDAEVGFYIAALAPIVPFMYLESIVTGILHGLGQQMSTLKYNLANSALRISAVLFFVPKFGMPGFLWIMIFSNLYTSISCLHRLFHVANIHIQWRHWVVAPALCCAIALLACQVYNRFGTGLLHLLGGGVLFMVVFAVFAYISGVITHADFAQIHTALHRQKQKQ
ncbi:MAG: oligosaccharide flippase family protein [Clostridia bacterium]|nr:oligosaccharide flippase family protein [Clostridia bacterium]